MRVAHLSTYDCQQGAGKAAWRLHDSLRALGVYSTMYVADKGTDDGDVVQLRRKSRFFLNLARLLPGNYFRHKDVSAIDDSWFDPDVDTRYKLCALEKAGCDVLVVHLTRHLASSKQVADLARSMSVPVVCVMVDMAPLTGGCHLHFDCDRFKSICHKCPQLVCHGGADVALRIWRNKERHLKPLDMTFICSTDWLSRRKRESGIFSHSKEKKIPLAIDDRIYFAGKKHVARKKLGLDINSKIIFFGAHSVSDPRKGIDCMIEAIRHLESDVEEFSICDNIQLLTAGYGDVSKEYGGMFKLTHLGYVDEKTLAEAYRASNVFVCPSLYDAGPMMIPEAMMCGTPVVAFDSGGAPDLIRTGRNGYLAKFKNSRDLAMGIREILYSEQSHSMCLAAHDDSHLKHNPATVANQYLELFKELVNVHN